MTKASLSAVCSNNLDPSQTSPCSWCQHAELIHAYAGPCLFSECECPFITPAPESHVVALWSPMTPNVDDAVTLARAIGRADRLGA